MTVTLLRAAGVGLDPLHPRWRRVRHRKIENWDGLPVATTITDDDDLVARAQIHAFDDDPDSKHRRLKRDTAGA